MRRFLHYLAVAALAVIITGQLAFGQAPIPRSVQAQIDDYETKLAGSGGFDWTIHNELRHLYGGFDEAKSFHHCDVILKNSRMDKYILSILSGWEIDKDTAKAVENLQTAAEKHAELRFVRAACWLMAGDLEESKDRARACYDKVLALQGPDLDGYRDLARRARSRVSEAQGGEPPMSEGTTRKRGG